jgi:hypothetical protein
MSTFHSAKLFKRQAALKAWLTSRGAEVLVTTNPYEFVRYRAASETHVLYRKGDGSFTVTKAVLTMVSAFLGNQAWSAGVATKRKARNPVEVRALLARDGEGCFLCGKPLGDDITVEHLVAVVHGGPNHIANKALMHEVCNQRVHHLSVFEKVRMRDDVRAQVGAAA